jgi:hypothetical protein
VTVALIVAVILAIAVVVYVALPFLREPEPDSDVLEELNEDERRRLELLEARDRALAALKEIEFDHRTGALTDDDYRALVTPLRQEAARLLKALDAMASDDEPSPVGKGHPVRERTST